MISVYFYQFDYLAKKGDYAPLMGPGLFRSGFCWVRFLWGLRPRFRSGNRMMPNYYYKDFEITLECKGGFTLMRIALD